MSNLETHRAKASRGAFFSLIARIKAPRSLGRQSSAFKAGNMEEQPTCTQQSLSGGGLALPGLQHVPHVDLLHFFRSDP